MTRGMFFKRLFGGAVAGVAAAEQLKQAPVVEPPRVAPKVEYAGINRGTQTFEFFTSCAFDALPQVAILYPGPYSEDAPAREYFGAFSTSGDLMSVSNPADWHGALVEPYLGQHRRNE